MRAVLLKSYFLWPYATGGERSQTSTMAALSRADIDIVVRYAIPPGLPQESYNTFHQLINRFGFRIHDEGTRHITYEVERIAVQAHPVAGSPATWVGDWLDELRPDVVCVSAKDTYFLPIITAFWPGPGYIFIQDLASLEAMANRLSPESLLRLQRKGWTCIASSGFLHDKTKDILDIDSKILYPVIPMEPATTPIPDSGPIIMFGTDKGKGIDIFRSIARTCIDSRFVAICGWEYKSVPHADEIEYLPFALSSDPFLKQCRAVVVPSRYEEGFGRVAFEAMARGRPVITSDQGALPEVIGKAGLVVPIPSDISVVTKWEKALETVTDSKRAQIHAMAGLKRSKEIIKNRNRQFEDIFGVPFNC